MDISNTTVDANTKKTYTKTYTLKDGTTVTKEYPQHLYNKKYYELNKEKYLNKYKCDVCKIDVNISSKWQHNNTKKHLYYYNLKYTTNEIL